MSKVVKKMQMDVLEKTFKGVPNMVFLNMVGLSSGGEAKFRREMHAKKIRLQLTIRLAEPAQVAAIAQELRRGASGTVRVTVPLPGDRQGTILLGRNFLLDADLVGRLEHQLGEGSVDLSVQAPPQLALVG